ncbi:MAG: VWA domain-containing protein [Parvibaculaceae bacterium]
MRSALRLALAALGLCLLLGTVLSAQAEEKPGVRVILVLDASGSMWGKINGRVKIDIARETVAGIVARWRPQDELGLVVYGHREKGNCGDIEVMLEPGPLDPGAFMAAVNGLFPKGMTPMTAAVREAAEALRYTEKESTIILVSDGIETCNQDPCAVAEELERNGIGLTVHTVGFGIDDEGARAQLQCLADRTGGLSLTADNAEELEEALGRTVVAAQSGAPAEPPPAPEPSPYTFTGHARLAPGAELPEKFDTANWEFYRALADGTAGEWVRTEYGRDLKLELAPGQYVLKVAASLAKVELPLSIASGQPVQLDVDLNAGLVRLEGRRDAETPVADSTSWEFRDAAGNQLSTLYGRSVEALLPAGSNSVKMTVGEASVEASLEVVAGQILEQALIAGSGVLTAIALFAEGGPEFKRDAVFEVQKGGSSIDGTRESVTTKYDAQSRFDLPAGDYVVVFTSGLAKAEQQVHVEPGKETVARIIANAGFLAVNAQGAEVIEVYDGELDLTGERTLLTTKYEPTFNAAAKAGSYHVKAKLSNGETIGEATVTVEPGQRAEVKLP